MCSIISFGNVRMSVMGKNLVTSYAALGVGLAIVLTFGLAAISSVTEQPSQFMASQRESAVSPLAPSAPEEKPALEAPVPEPPALSSEMQEDVSAKAGAPSGAGGATSGEVVIEKAPRQEETAKESYSIAAEVPAGTSAVAGLLGVLPYIAAVAVGSVVFAVTRKRVRW